MQNIFSKKFKNLVVMSLIKLRIIVVFLLILVFFNQECLWAIKEPKKRVAILNFENKTPDWNPVNWGKISSDLGGMLSAELVNSGKFVVLERDQLQALQQEQELNEKGEVTSESGARDKKLLGAQLLILGSIDNLEYGSGSDNKLKLRNLGPLEGLGAVGLKRGSSKATVGMNIRMIDTVTGEVLFSESVESSASSNKVGLDLDLRKIDFSTEVQGKTTLGEATRDAIHKASLSIQNRMRGLPWKGRVIKSSGKQVYINAGQKSNIEKGMVLSVFEEGEPLLDPETGKNLGSEDILLGKIRIDKVRESFSIGLTIEGEAFERNNIVQLIEADEKTSVKK